MKKVLIVILGVALSLGAFAFATRPANPGAGGQCIRAGVTTLVSLGAISAAAQGQVDYSGFADAEDGPIFADLPRGSNLPLNVVIGLHRTNSELFAWGAN